jgi:alpha-L-rhamnosidase
MIFARTRSLFLLPLIALYTLTTHAQDHRPLDARLESSQWPAKWIACPGAPQRDAGVFYFRKELTLAAAPAHFWVHVSADNRFLLHVNGAYAGEGPARGDLFHWRFETIDLAPLLHPGKNLLAGVVWNFGLSSPVAQMSSRTGFLLQGNSTSEDIANTDESWQVKEERGRGAMAHDGAHGYYAAGPAERIEGRELDWSWDQDDAQSGWLPATVIGRAATRGAQDANNAWELVQDPLPPMEHRLVAAGEPVQVSGLANSAALPSFPAKPLDVAANSHMTLLLDNRVLQTAYPALTVSGGRDAVIRVTYAEALYDAQGNKGNRNEIEGRHIEGITDEFLADGGDRRVFQPLWWRTWRYLLIDVTTKAAPLHLDSLQAWFSAYPFEERAKIGGDIPELDALWSTGWRTARLCAHETYMDAPYWEQLQYVGDTRIQALISYVMTGDSRLGRQAITNIDDSRTIEGITQSRYPSGLPQMIPTFSLLWVNMVHDYWMYVDDEPLVRETLPHTRTVIDWFAARQRPDGLLGKMPWWEFGDWTSGYKAGVPPQDADGGSTFLTLQFVGALHDAAELETRYGSAERAAHYREMIQSASAALNRSNWDAQAHLYADTPAKQSFSTEANVLAVLTDVAPQAEQASILRRVLASQEKIATTLDGQPVPAMSQMSFYFRFYLSRALEHAGVADLYLDQLGPWRQMLSLGLSTWAETPEPTRSDCHAWSASPNYDLLTVVAGMQPDAPGFKRVRITPHLGNLKHLDASMPHGADEIHVHYERHGQKWTASIELPAALAGDLVWHGENYPLHPGRQTLELPWGAALDGRGAE